MDREDPKNLQKPAYQTDAQGRPLIEHRPLFHTHIPGGGLWVATASVMMDFGPFLTGQPIARLTDSVSLVSGSSILAPMVFLPRHKGSDEPLYPDFREPRKRLFQVAREKVFPNTRVKRFESMPDWVKKVPMMGYDRHSGNFFSYRILQDVRQGTINRLHMLNISAHKFHANTIRSLTDIFDTSKADEDRRRHPVVRGLRYGIRSLFNMSAIAPLFGQSHVFDDDHLWMNVEALRNNRQQRADQIKEKTESKLEVMARGHEDKVHMNSQALFEQLRENFKVLNPQSGEKDDARMKDMLVPCVISSINVTSPIGNEYTRYVNPPTEGGERHVFYRMRKSFRPDVMIATASLHSSKLPLVYTTQQDPEDGHHYSDGGSAYSPARGTKDTLAMFSPAQHFVTTTYECNMSDRPPRVTPKSLNRQFLFATVLETLPLNVRPSRRADDLDVEGMATCAARNEFSRPVYFNAPPLPQGSKVRESMDAFSRWAVGMGIDECMNTYVPPTMGTSTQIDPSPKSERLFSATGIQAVVRNLPEMVEHIKHNVVRGPLSDRLTHTQQAEMLTHIDLSFPPAELEALKAERVYDRGIDPALVGNYVQEDERDTAQRLQRMLVRPKRTAPQQVTGQPEFAPAK